MREVNQKRLNNFVNGQLAAQKDRLNKFHEKAEEFYRANSPCPWNLVEFTGIMMKVRKDAKKALDGMCSAFHRYLEFKEFHRTRAKHSDCPLDEQRELDAALQNRKNSYLRMKRKYAVEVQDILEAASVELNLLIQQQKEQPTQFDEWLNKANGRRGDD